VAGEHGLDIRDPQRAKVAAPIHAPADQLDQRRRNIGREADPGDAGAGTRPVRRWKSELVSVQKVREVHAGALRDGVIAPCTRVYVKQLVASVAFVVLVLEMDETVVVDRPLKALRRLPQIREVDS